MNIVRLGVEAADFPRATATHREFYAVCDKRGKDSTGYPLQEPGEERSVMTPVPHPASPHQQPERSISQMGTHDHKGPRGMLRRYVKPLSKLRIYPVKFP